MYVSGKWGYMSLGAIGGQRASDLPELELKGVVSHPT